MIGPACEPHPQTSLRSAEQHTKIGKHGTIVPAGDRYRLQKSCQKMPLGVKKGEKNKLPADFHNPSLQHLMFTYSI